MKQFYILSMLILTSTFLSAQSKFDVRIFKHTRSDFGLSYNFFEGENIDNFRTTIKGFGSGFLIDAFSGRYSKDIIFIGVPEVNVTAGAGVAISKYRFAEPIIFQNENGEFSYSIDEDPAHSYGNGFLSNDKSKLVVGSLILPAHVNFDIGKWYLSMGGTLDVFLAGKHKRKFTIDGSRQTIVTKNEQFNDFPINRTKWGLSAMIMHQPSGVNVGVTWMRTPFFKRTIGLPELREVRVSFSYNLSNRKWRRWR